MRLTQADRIALLMHGGTDNSRGKTGLALLRYGQIPIAAVIDSHYAGQDLVQVTGIPRQAPIVESVEAALSYQPTTLVIGIAPSGGSLPDPWLNEITQAVKAGLNIVNGLHSRLSQHPKLRPLLKSEQWIWDIRQEPEGLSVGSAQARLLPCQRVLTVGTDMSVGKMSTNLELHRACVERGLRSKIIATGQTNLMLGDDGIALDAIRVDFAAGAVEQQVMRYGNDHDILFIEGQGSLLNPASTATLPLLRGSQPTHLVLVHRAGQKHIRHFPHIPIPPLKAVVDLYEAVAAVGTTLTEKKVVAIALNTSHLSGEQAQAAIEAVQTATNLPCSDVIRYGPGPVLQALLSR